MNTNASLHGLIAMGPMEQLRAGRLPERLIRLLAGLWLYGLAIALMIEGALGASPWDVFHLGVALHAPLSLGVVMIITAVVVLLAWIPLRQMPGLGTIANTLLIGPFADLNLAWLDSPGDSSRRSRTCSAACCCAPSPPRSTSARNLGRDHAMA